jgi:DNA-binding Lrp family transcriptional regulator
LRPPDELDIRLMREFASPASYRWDVTESLSSMARKLGVDEETVRRRLKRAQLNGLLGGFHLIPNPHLLGCDAAEVDLEVAREDKDDAISQLKLVDGVLLVVDFHGKALRVMIYYQTEEESARKIRLVSAICRSETEVHWKDPFPPCGLEMRETDWRILKSLRRDARKSLPQVAKEVGVSVRTVRRRLALMTEANAFFLLPLPSFGKLASVLCNFRVYCPDERQKKAVDEQIKSRLERMVFSKTTAKEYSVFSVLCDNLAEAEVARRWIEGLRGVEDVKSGFSKELVVVDGWLDETIGSKLQ